MYEICVEETTCGVMIIKLENVKLSFENKEDGNNFLLKLLKETGRIGY